MASKLQDLINRLCPNGVEYRKLGEVCSYATERIDSSAVSSHTYVGVESLLQDRCGRVDSVSVPSEGRVIAFKPGDVLVGNIRPYLKKIWLSDIDGGTNGDVLVFQIRDRGKLLPRFLYQVLASDSFFAFDMQYAKGSKMPRGDKEAVLKYEIPVPPLEVQGEIVQILDNFAELTAELTAELEKRKKQYEHYRRALLCGGESSGWPMVKLGDVCEMCLGKMLDRAKNKGRPYKYLANVNVRWGSFDLSDLKEMLFEDDESERFGLKIGDIVMCEGGEPGRCAVWNGEYHDIRFQKALHRLRTKPSVLNNRFLYHWFSLAGQTHLYDKLFTGSTIKHLPGVVLADLTIPLPPLAEQRRIVSILDRFDRLCNDLTSGLPAEIAARKRQYAYYRDRLLDFKPAPKGCGAASNRKGAA